MYPLKLSPSRLGLSFLLAWLFALAIGWRQSGGEEEVPPGCEDVFAATSRGGSIGLSGGGGCNVFRNTGGEKLRVSRVIDGDTIVVSGGRRVRYQVYRHRYPRGG